MNPVTRSQRQRAYSRKKGSTVAALASLQLRITVGLFLLMSMVVYVIQVNTVSVKGFAIFEIEQSITSLERENQRLELHVAQLQSTETLQQHIEKLGMTDEGETEYITVIDNSVAKR